MMQENLIIYLHANNLAEPSWVVMTNDTLTAAVEHGDPLLLQEASQHREVVVVVPAEDVLLLQTNLPKMSRHRLAQALPFALEEQLVTDLDKLHFAALPLNANTYAVAVVAHEKMLSWLQLLKEWQVQADKLISSVQIIPVKENMWSLVVDEMVTVRTDEHQGFACDIENVDAILAFAYEQAQVKPTRLHLINTQKTNVNFSSTLLPHTEEKITFSDYLHTALRHQGHAANVNLLQGIYAGKKNTFRKQRKLGKVLIGLSVSFALLLFAYPLISYFILHHRLSALDKQIAAIYKDNFPQATSIIAPKIRMQEKLQKFNSEVSDNRLLLLLGFVGKTLSADQAVKLERFDFQNNQLTLDLIAQTSEDLTAFSEGLAQAGLSVKQQNTNVSDTALKATLLIE